MWCSNGEGFFIMLCVETMGMFATFDNIFGLMLKCLIDFGGLGLKGLLGKLVNIDCDGSNVFQGHKMRVIQQFNEKVVPFIMWVQYFAHKTNFTVITLSDVPFMH
jgi:hypothetical protein